MPAPACALVADPLYSEAGQPQVSPESPLQQPATGPTLSLADALSGEERGGLVGPGETLLPYGPASWHAAQLVLRLGRAQLTAGYGAQQEQEDRWQRQPGKDTRPRKVELTAPLGPGGSGQLRLAISSGAAPAASEGTRQEAREAHLSVTPTAAWRLNADYTTQRESNGSEQTTRVVGSALRLAPGAELSASLNTLDDGAGAPKQERVLGLTAQLGIGRLAVEEKVAQVQGHSAQQRSYTFAGGVGAGAARLNIKADLRATASGGPAGEVAGSEFLHLDRGLGSALGVTFEHRSSRKGVESSQEERWEAVARLGPGTRLTGEVAQGTVPAGATGRRRLAMAHDWRHLRLRAEIRQARQENGSEDSVVAAAVEAPIGELPAWAKTAFTAHQFSDASQYLVAAQPFSPDAGVPFAGYRLWVALRRGATPEAAADTFGLAYRRLLAGRWHLHWAHVEHPEGAEGAARGRPLPLTRHTMEIAGRAWGGVNGRLGLGLESGQSGPAGESRLRRLRLGLWGALRENEQLEAEISRDSGRWEGAERERTTIAVLYSHRVSEDQQVELKAGYSLAAGEDGEPERDRRLSLSYEKPI